MGLVADGQWFESLQLVEDEEKISSWDHGKVFTFETFVTVTELIKANAGRQEVTAAGFVSFERKSLHQTSWSVHIENEIWKLRPFQLVQSFPFSFPPFINCVWSDLFLFLGRYFRFRNATKIFRSLQTTVVSQRAVSIGALLAPCWSASFVPTRRYLQFPGLPGSKTLCKLTLTI